MITLNPFTQNRMFFSTLLAVFVSIFFLVSLSGCSKPEPLVIGIHPWIGYQPPLLNADQGVPENIEYRHGESALQTMQGLRDQTLDAGYLTLDESLILISEGVPLKIALVANSSAGADQVVSREVSLEADNIKQLTIGYEQNALGELMLWHFLKAYQLHKGDVSVRHVPMTQQGEAYKSGQIDIAINYPPYTKNVTQYGAGKVFDSTEIPNTIVDVLVVHQTAVDGKGALIHRAVEHHLKGVRYVKQNPGDARFQMAEILDITSQDVGDALNGINLTSPEANYHLLEKGGEIEGLIEKLLTILQQADVLQSTPRLAATNWLTDEYLP